MKWASAIATPARLEDAIDEAADTVASELEGAAADLVLCFVGPDYADHYTRLLPTLRARFPDAALAGCSAGGVIGGGLEIERRPALSLTAASLPGVEASPFYLGPNPADWAEVLERPAAPTECFVLLPDPQTCAAEDLVATLDALEPASVKIGGLASGGTQPGSNLLIAGDRIERAGAVGIGLRGNIAVDTVVAQGCRPIGSPMFVTRAEGHVAFELDGAPALEVLEGLHAGLPPADRALFQHSLFLGLVMDDRQQLYRHGDFVIRGILGADPKLGALALGASVEAGQVVQFHLRDADTSAEDLHTMLEQHADQRTGRAAGALLFSCLGRGESLYGHPNHDTDLFHEHLGPIPLGGFFCGGEIGPVLGKTHLHGYTSSFALFRDRR